MKIKTQAIEVVEDVVDLESVIRILAMLRIKQEVTFTYQGTKANGDYFSLEFSGAEWNALLNLAEKGARS